MHVEISENLEINRYTETWVQIHQCTEIHTHRAREHPVCRLSPHLNSFEGQLSELCELITYPDVSSGLQFSPGKVTVETRERAVVLNSRHHGMTAV